MRSAGAVGSGARGASTPAEGGEGRGHIVAAARLQLVIIITGAGNAVRRRRYCDHFVTMCVCVSEYDTMIK